MSDPLGTIGEAFFVGKWTVTIHQGVTGGLFWVAQRGNERLHAHFPAGFSVADVRADAERALRITADP